MTRARFSSSPRTRKPLFAQFAVTYSSATTTGTYAETECGQFERELCDYFGTRHALAVTSGTAALALAIMAAGIPAGSLIACPGFTFVATPSAIVMAGCRPLLIEVTEDLHLDLADLRRRWTPEIKAIMVVHMRGFASDVEALADFAAEMGVPLFEDAVPALGAELNGRKLGTFGLAGGFSTQSDKSLNSGEGGFLLTDDDALYARAVVLAGAYEGRVARHFPDGPHPLDTDLRPAAAQPADGRDPRGAAALGTGPAAAAAGLLPPQLRLRGPGTGRRRGHLDPAAGRGRCLPRRGLHLPGAATVKAQWFADALCAEGIDARNLGSSRDANVRAFWNWRFLFPGAEVDEIKAGLPVTTGYLEDAVDVALSSTLEADDCDHLITAVRRIARALDGRAGAVSELPPR